MQMSTARITIHLIHLETLNSHIFELNLCKFPPFHLSNEYEYVSFNPSLALTILLQILGHI